MQGEKNEVIFEWTTKLTGEIFILLVFYTYVCLIFLLFLI